MESASVMALSCVKALSGMALAPTEEVVRLGVVPEPERTEEGAFNTCEDGVYRTEPVSAFDPADDEAEEEYEVAAPAPVAPDEALD